MIYLLNMGYFFERTSDLPVCVCVCVCVRVHRPSHDTLAVCDERRDLFAESCMSRTLWEHMPLIAHSHTMTEATHAQKHSALHTPAF